VLVNDWQRSSASNSQRLELIHVLVPNRLLSLSYGAKLVWGPEIVDRAMIGATRTVDGRPFQISPHHYSLTTLTFRDYGHCTISQARPENAFLVNPSDREESSDLPDREL
jgi:hypothetical protein